MIIMTPKRGSLLEACLSRGIFPLVSLVEYSGFSPRLCLEARDLPPKHRSLQQLLFFPPLGIWLLIGIFSLGGGKEGSST